MKAGIHVAQTQADRDAVFRLRYQTYIEEMRLFGLDADHDERKMVDRRDESARLLVAQANGQTVGTVRLNCGLDASFTSYAVEAYDLDRFRSILAENQIATLSRFTVKEGYRDSAIPQQLIVSAVQMALDAGVELLLCDSQPHLIHFYHQLGFRSFGGEMFNDPAFGLMAPLALVLGDLPFLKALNSPLFDVLSPAPINDERAARLAQVLMPAMPQHHADSFDFLEDIEDQDLLHPLEPADVSILEGLTDDQIDHVLSDGFVIACAPGDLLIEQGETNNTLYILLSGTLIIEINGRRITDARPGDIVGEIAFVLSGQRTANVFAGPDGACVLGLNGHKLNQNLDANQSVASTVLQNLSMCLATRITNLMDHEYGSDEPLVAPKLPPHLGRSDFKASA